MSEQPMKPNVSGFETCTYREVIVNGMRCLRPGDDPDWRLKPLAVDDVMMIRPQFGDFSYRVVAFEVLGGAETGEARVGFVRPWKKRAPAPPYPPMPTAIGTFPGVVETILGGLAETGRLSVEWDGPHEFMGHDLGWFSMMVTDACESGFRPGALELEVHRVLTEKCLAHSFGWPVVFPPDLDGDMIRDCAEEAGTEHVVVFRGREDG